MTIQTETGNRLTGFYRGEVVKHCLGGYGKCKVWIPGVYSDKFKNTPDMLPDAEQISPLFGGSWNGNGVFSYPNLHSIVICGFYNGDQNLPFFFGSTLGGNAKNGAKDNYAKCQKNITPDTLKNGTDAYNHIVSADKSTILISEGGYIDILTKGDRGGGNNVHIVCDGKGNLTISTTQQVQIESPNIKISAGQSMEITSPQLKINATQSYELNAQTVKETVSSAASRTAQDVTLIGSNTVNAVAPTINIDGSTGTVGIKAQKSSDFYY